VIGTAARLLLRPMRPGLEKETRLALIFLPFSVAITAALVMLPQVWSAMLRGATSVSPARCLVCTVLFATIPFATLGMGDSAGRIYAVKAQRSDCRSGSRRTWRRSRRPQLLQRHDPLQCVSL
jgi:hypothetical protein